jgi:hypothetical protein
MCGIERWIICTHGSLDPRLRDRKDGSDIFSAFLCLQPECSLHRRVVRNVATYPYCSSRTRASVSVCLYRGGSFWKIRRGVLSIHSRDVRYHVGCCPADVLRHYALHVTLQRTCIASRPVPDEESIAQAGVVRGATCAQTVFYEQSRRWSRLSQTVQAKT